MGGADTEPSRFSAAAAWSKPILTTPQGDFPPRMSPENRIYDFARMCELCEAYYYHPGSL